MPKPEAASIIEIVGEGKTDRGEGGDQPERQAAESCQSSCTDCAITRSRCGFG